MKKILLLGTFYIHSAFGAAYGPHLEQPTPSAAEMEDAEIGMGILDAISNLGNSIEQLGTRVSQLEARSSAPTPSGIYAPVTRIDLGPINSKLADLNHRLKTLEQRCR